jgi:cell division topological specificity factor
MASLFDRVMGKGESASTAKERLQLVLVHDRTNLPAGQMENMKNEIIQVISKYVEIDRMEAEIEMERNGREQRLVMNIPLNSRRDKRGAF